MVVGPSRKLTMPPGLLPLADVTVGERPPSPMHGFRFEVMLVELVAWLTSGNGSRVAGLNPVAPPYTA